MVFVIIQNVDAYIASFPLEVREILFQIRAIIKKKAPKAIETLSYGMPAYKVHGSVLVYFAAFKNHIGFYATPSGHEEYKKELSAYKQGKGSVQFSLSKTIPYDLIGQIVEFRVYENALKAKINK
ncbi:MAG: DUF1801 domain-containing protein [Lentimicrobium sp.]|nr:DUF1801 domain-containing protein [Lentimicrobium sp.]